jgi:hypothetical protein
MRRLMGFINGYRTTQAIHVAVVLGIPELVAHGPRSPSDLANKHSPCITAPPVADTQGTWPPLRRSGRRVLNDAIG